MRGLKFIGFGWTLIGNETAKAIGSCVVVDQLVVEFQAKWTCQVFAEVAKQQKDLQMSLNGNKIGPEGLKVSDVLSDWAPAKKPTGPMFEML